MYFAIIASNALYWLYLHKEHCKKQRLWLHQPQSTVRSKDKWIKTLDYKFERGLVHFIWKKGEQLVIFCYTGVMFLEIILND
jgi:hypothetical protein